MPELSRGPRKLRICPASFSVMSGCCSSRLTVRATLGSVGNDAGLQVRGNHSPVVRLAVRGVVRHPRDFDAVIDGWGSRLQAETQPLLARAHESPVGARCDFIAARVLGRMDER